MGLLRDGIKAGVVKPLNRTVFQRDEAEKAFRYMGTGTHIGKVLIKVCKVNNSDFHGLFNSYDTALFLFNVYSIFLFYFIFVFVKYIKIYYNYNHSSISKSDIHY